MSELRPLPPRPSLEFEHKQAKALLRRLRSGDPDSIARARTRHPSMDVSKLRLADAQLVIAREYGFKSWPRLVQYFGDLERQRYGARSIQSDRGEHYDASVRNLLAEHRLRRGAGGRAFAAYVPRFYGTRLEEVFAATVTEEDARLAVARMNGFATWDVLLERRQNSISWRDDDWELNPMQRVGKAIQAADLKELQRVVDAHPELLDWRDSRGSPLFNSALHYEMVLGREVMQPIMDWLALHGFDRQLELNRQLCGHMYMKAETVRELLDRGADPNWVAPTGIPVLEHALIRYWSGQAVDALAERVVPRQALWISAGLGDLNGVRRSLDANGKPADAARRLRPDFDAVGARGVLSHPDPDDEEILMEAFFIAILNGRTAVLEYMVSQGFPVNSLVYDSPIINFAVGNAMTAMVECLVRCGADLNLRGWMPTQSAREIARSRFEDAPQNVDLRRIVELCGMDPDGILAERNARPAVPLGVEPKLQEALDLAGDDAFRLGKSDINPENLLFGLLRSGGLPRLFMTKVSGVDVDRFRADVWHRVNVSDNAVERPKLPLNPASQAMIKVAIAVATEKGRETLQGLHLLYALAQDEHGPLAELLALYGSSAAILKGKLESSL
jgi:hypothetical protein